MSAQPQHRRPPDSPLLTTPQLASPQHGVAPKRSEQQRREHKARIDLGRLLRQARGGLTQKTAADAVRVSTAKLSRMERGQHELSPEDVRALLHFYGTAPAVLNVAERLLQISARGGWWSPYPAAVRRWMTRYLQFEPQAVEIKAYERDWVPGLCQTPEYAEAVARRDVAGLTEREAQSVVSQRVELRRARQLILERDVPPLLSVVMDEAILHREVADREVMVRQFRHLMRMAARPGVNVRVLPANAPPSVFPSAVTLLTFPPELRSGVVYVEKLDNADYDGNFEAHRIEMDNLWATCASRTGSLRMLAQAARRFSAPGRR